jgi:tRNA(Arg) A34 adenosine deaminase TadA
MPFCAKFSRIPRESHAACAGDPKAGTAGRAMNLLQFPTLNHCCEITCGKRETECRALLRDFQPKIAG